VADRVGQQVATGVEFEFLTGREAAKKSGAEPSEPGRPATRQTLGDSSRNRVGGDRSPAVTTACGER